MININYKRIVVLVIAIFVMLLSNKTHSQDYPGDLGIRNNTNQEIIARISLVSIPFDGITANINTGTYNRIDTLQNGSVTRVFDWNNNYTEYPLHYFYKQLSTNGSSLQLGLVGGNPSDANHGFGHGVYEIYIEVPSINKKYKAHFNCMDSKYGAPINGVTYGRDFNFTYLGGNDDVLFTAGADVVATLRPFTEGQIVQEFKVWEMCGFGNQPLEQRFYARTSPFGVSPKIIEETIDRNYMMREFTISGKVIFDKVYNSYGSTDRWGYNTINALPYHLYFSNPPIPPNQNSEGNTYTTPAWFTFDLNSNYLIGCRITALSGDELILKENKRLWVSGYETNQDYGDTLVLKSGSIITKETGSQLNACFGGTILDFGATMNWGTNSFTHIFTKSELSYLGTTHTINNGGHVEIDANARLKIGDNSTVTFDGAGTYLKLNPNAIVQLGQNAKIEFKNGAYMIANGGTIASLNASTPGRGLYFENAGGQTSITNCTFNNLTNSVHINNSVSEYVGTFKYLYGNTFNTNNNCNYVIETKNANNITISNNQINMSPGVGIGILMRYPSNLSEGEAASTPFTVNVTGNYISNGNISAAFICFTNSYAGINFRYNNCNGNVSTANVIERQVIGDFKYNSISSVSCKNFEITQSNPNVYSNTFNTSNININNYSSYPCFAPVSNNSSDGGWVWNGGKNNINSTGNGNINFDNGNVLLDWGQNCFLKNQGYNHLWGQIDENSLSYKVRNNDFSNSNIPTTYLFDVTSGYRVYPYSTGSDFGCNNSTDAGTIWLINDLGNGFYDTLYKTSNTSGYQPSQDEVLYSTATQKMILDQNFDAVSYFKSLITGFPGSSYSEACLYSLYSCYQKLDTSSNQGVRDILYTDLKNYLDGRILTGLYSDEFNYTAYNITMMCLASIAEYNDAMSGYEFIALYHPDAYTRLLASWDYAEIQELLNGSGGTSSKEENLTDAEYFAKLTKRVSKGINEDPIKKKVKKSFDKVKTEKTSKVEKDAIAKTNDVKSAKLEVAKMKQKDEMMNTKVTSVMRYSKTLKKEEREKMQIEDILFSNKSESKDEIKVNVNVPEVYSLSQNYPNPFNPVTKINFALPKQGYVSLKIYDITGREIQTLVNEVKQAGYYSVDFNGSSLSSGVYFYMIKSGDFVQTKRMLMIK